VVRRECGRECLIEGAGWNGAPRRHRSQQASWSVAYLYLTYLYEYITYLYEYITYCYLCRLLFCSFQNPYLVASYEIKQPSYKVVRPAVI